MKMLAALNPTTDMLLSILIVAAWVVLCVFIYRWQKKNRKQK